MRFLISAAILSLLFLSPAQAKDTRRGMERCCTDQRMGRNSVSWIFHL